MFDFRSNYFWYTNAWKLGFLLEANMPKSQNQSQANQGCGFSPQLPNQKASMRSFKSSKDLRKSQRISWQTIWTRTE